MAKNPAQPAAIKSRPVPDREQSAKHVAAPAPVAFEQPKYDKRTSYSPEQGNAEGRRDFHDRNEYSLPERGQKLAPAQPKPPVRDWGNGSYCVDTGRSASVHDEDRKVNGGNQMSRAGRHTEGKQGEPRRPGRW
jgi:hypothetical protein